MALLRWLLLASLLSALTGAQTEDARISSIPEAPGWQLDSLMHLQLTAPETEALQLTYSVYPLTAPAGLNESEAVRSDIWIRGSLVSAESPVSSERLTIPRSIVFLSCDPENATQVFNEFMAEEPRAILLYSLDGNCCALEGEDLRYTTIYTMTDSGEAWDTLNNTDRAGGILRATISGNSTVTIPEPGSGRRNGSNSAVAMSILYSITGLITLLFLVIIATGAIRAHRYPERYGPRSGYGGRPRQSRAKGLARAVLETLPVVKFGDPSPGKPDPALELESQRSGASPDPGMGTRLSAIPEEPRSPEMRQSTAAPMSGAVSALPETLPMTAATTTTGQAAAIAPAMVDADDKGEPKTEHRPSEEHLGCSICTEDFTVGEDVRVLPCDHKFHPPCIDPWLINISGTCPLCRLDLRPHDEQSTSASSDSDDNPLQLPPPLSITEWQDPAAAPNPTTTTSNTTMMTTQQQQQRRRSSRFLDLHRLRNASVEERIEILRRHRSQQQHQRRESAASGGDETEEQRGRRAARLADRLRERFRVRTRTQSPARGTD
ncbi:E3 ubiquitin-protein ligase SDIR1 [Madurella mycetomatis]|uniref:RING-type E3 ubiquitin transferase n=1 Tax=Madurella mycetomatis TaxID=100816 RepID=A0A175VPJ1_9PEZI|nr:E3 ubiquitin-protein ligase SDIR1 [Madurella mycetomatis]